MDMEEAYAKVVQLHSDLQALVDRDPEQEVHGPALRVLDAVVEAARVALPDDPVVASIEFISPEAVEAGEPLRVADTMVTVGQLEAALARALPDPPVLDLFGGYGGA